MIILRAQHWTIETWDNGFMVCSFGMNRKFFPNLSDAENWLAPKL